MMYFKEPSSGDLVLKAIDFGSCKLLSTKVADRQFVSYGPEYRANFCRKIFDIVGTLRYNSPEIRFNNMCNDASWEESAKQSSNNHIVVIQIINIILHNAAQRTP
jgi:hypothetical protein